MAIRPKDQYPGQVDILDAGYPYGKARNQNTAGDGSGTPLERTWLNDLFGFQQALLAAARLQPSGLPDKVSASQYLEAIQELLKQERREAQALNWPYRSTNTVHAGGGIAYADGLKSGRGCFVAVSGESSSAQTFYSSADGLIWTPNAGHTNRHAWCCTASPTLLVVGQAPLFFAAADKIATSADGQNWVQRNLGTSSTGSVTALHWTGSLYLAGLSNGELHTSPDGFTWTPRTSVVLEQFNAFASSSSAVVAVMASGKLQTSPDAATWTDRGNPDSVAKNGVAWSEDFERFVAVGAGGKIWRSPDGETWTNSATLSLHGNTPILRSVCAARGLVVAAYCDLDLGLGFFYSTDPNIEEWKHVGLMHAGNTNDERVRVTFAAGRNAFVSGCSGYPSGSGIVLQSMRMPE